MPQKNHDSNALAMLHSTVLHSGTEQREALTTGLDAFRESVEASLGAMKGVLSGELQDIGRRLTAVQQDLADGRAGAERGSGEVRRSLEQLQSEVERLREAVQTDRRPRPEPPAPGTAEAPVPDPQPPLAVPPGPGEPARAGADRAPESGSETGAHGPQVTEAHRDLLCQAARISSAFLVCHRDLWEFVSGLAGRHAHFRMPSQIADRGDDRIAAALSGRSLIAVLISLWEVRHAAEDGGGDWALATTVYGRIQDGLAALAPGGDPVTITLDDRSPAEDDAGPSAAVPARSR
ncbi:hypothetical protein [Streptomyces sp. TR06-5]|uniref:hypothetical protein n=1 Tax=Streptomyces sp. TR06-5 TaxID=3385976 RepID=UPI0039A34116